MAFILLLYVGLIGLDYLWTVSDSITGAVYNSTNSVEPNYITNDAYTRYQDVRDFMNTSVNFFLGPWLIFLSFASSFINRNQDLISYLVYSVGIVMATPIAVYAFSELFTLLANVSLLNPSYLESFYLNNFVLVLVINMLFTLASFPFVRKGVTEA